MKFPFGIFVAALCVNAFTNYLPEETKAQSCDTEFIILGIGQDAGAPQIGNADDPAWTDPSLRLLAASGAVVDHRTGKRFLFEATPDMREQLHYLNTISASDKGPIGLSGIFLTHAHIGHYSGLMFAGHESAGTKGLSVFALPRMKKYLETNGPWSQLVDFENITISPISANQSVDLGDDISVIPYLVPHRDEYSETAAFVINGPAKNILFLPDIDDWDRWETEFNLRIEDMIAQVDVAYLDATFFDNQELPGRDMSKIPHPRLSASMDRFDKLAPSEREKVRFFHLNHTNRARFSDSKEHESIAERGYKLAKRGERICLD